MCACLLRALFSCMCVLRRYGNALPIGCAALECTLLYTSVILMVPECCHKLVTTCLCIHMYILFALTVTCFCLTGGVLQALLTLVLAGQGKVFHTILIYFTIKSLG